MVQENSKKHPPEAFRSPDLFERGMGFVLVARFKANGNVDIGCLLLDVFCLGVKDAYFHRFDREGYPPHLEKVFRESGREELTPACARKLVEDAVAYARKTGLAPHPDFKKAARVFGGIDAKGCTDEFVFGRDGKPFFMDGPNDSPARVRKIINTLTARCGKNGFHYMVSAENAIEGDEDELA